MNLRQLPNTLTIARILAVPPLLWLLVDERYPAAWWLALAAGVSDALDGMLAKRFHWVTRLGGLLDPIADKLLLAAGFIGLWIGGHVPTWLLALVLARDVLIVAGAGAWQGLIGPVPMTPSWLSKANTAIQIAFVLWLMLTLAYPSLPTQGQAVAVWLVAASTVASGLHYVVLWGNRARRVLKDVSL